MRYTFADNITLDEMKEAIAGFDEFEILDKGDYTVVNYWLASNKAFPTVTNRYEAIRHEARGLVFCNKTHKILSRRFHKFFNYGEREFTLPGNVDFSRPHVIMEKLDGSMVSPVIMDDKIVWMTKRGITDISKLVDEYVRGKPEYEAAVRSLPNNATAIFEYTSAQNRVVLRHETPALTLLSIRNIEDGNYHTKMAVESFGREKGIPVVRQYESSISTNDFIEQLKSKSDIEGVVIQFDDGHMVKVKTDWYCRIHRVLDEIKNEYEKVRLFAGDTSDDIISSLPEHIRISLEEFKGNFESSIIRNVSRIQFLYDKATGLSRKEFALKYIDKKQPALTSIVFAMLDGKADVDNPKRALYEYLLKVPNNTAMERVRYLWDNQ